MVSSAGVFWLISSSRLYSKQHPRQGTKAHTHVAAGHACETACTPQHSVGVGIHMPCEKKCEGPFEAPRQHFFCWGMQVVAKMETFTIQSTRMPHTSPQRRHQRPNGVASLPSPTCKAFILVVVSRLDRCRRHCASSPSSCADSSRGSPPAAVLLLLARAGLAAAAAAGAPKPNPATGRVPLNLHGLSGYTTERSHSAASSSR